MPADSDASGGGPSARFDGMDQRREAEGTEVISEAGPRGRSVPAVGTRRVGGHERVAACSRSTWTCAKTTAETMPRIRHPPAEFLSIARRLASPGARRVEPQQTIRLNPRRLSTLRQTGSSRGGTSCELARRGSQRGPRWTGAERRRAPPRATASSGGATSSAACTIESRLAVPPRWRGSTVPCSPASSARSSRAGTAPQLFRVRAPRRRRVSARHGPASTRRRASWAIPALSAVTARAAATASSARSTS
jgi:hypothetical protein